MTDNETAIYLNINVKGDLCDLNSSMLYPKVSVTYWEAFERCEVGEQLSVLECKGVGKES